MLVKRLGQRLLIYQLKNRRVCAITSIKLSASALVLCKLKLAPMEDSIPSFRMGSWMQ